MKWGVRNEKKSTGSSKGSGKKRDDSPEAVARRKAIGKKIAIGTAAGAAALTVAGAAVLYAKNPQARAAVQLAGDITLTRLKSAGAKVVAKGKSFVSKIPSRAKTSKSLLAEGAKEGAKIGLKEGAKNSVSKVISKTMETVAVGVAMNTVKRSMDLTVGKAEAERIFKANNKEKISNFWKV
jgi:hypothetical protein